MGACSFIEEIMASSVNEGFERLVNEAIQECGNDPYNGTISTCDLGRTVMKFDKYLKSNENKAYKAIEKDDYGEKWLAKAIDLGLIYYEVVTIKKETTKKAKPKWVMSYVVHGDKKMKSFKTKTEADEEAIKLLKAGEKDVCVTKEYINKAKDSEIVSKFKVEKKQTKTKPKSLKSNQVCKEIHKYMFYGFAAE